MEHYLRAQLFIAIIAYVGQAIVGVSLGWTAPVIPKLQDAQQTPLPSPITDEQSSWVGSLLYIGTIIGPYIGSYISNQFGRKPCLALGAALSAISFFVMAFSRHLSMIYAARILMGIGPGIIFVMNIVYLGEIASTKIRGILLTGTAIFSTMGTLVIYLIGPYVSFAGTCWLGFAISLAFLGGCYFIPESPVFQVLKAYVGQAIVGVSLGWTAPVIPKLQDAQQTPLPSPITDEQSSWVGSLLYIGTIIGPYIGSYISNEFGRKPCLAVGAALSAISFFVMAFSRHLSMIYAARILMGIGPGIIFVMNIVYLGEIASTKIRGILLTGTAIFSTMGTLVIYLIGPYVSFAGTCWLGFAISLAFLGGCYFIPESPVFQVLKGQEGKAKENLMLLGRADEIEIVIEASVDTAKSTKMDDWIELTTIKSNRKALFITLTLNTLQQTSGIVAVLFFATAIFELAGSSIEPHIATIIIGLTQFFASTITPWFVERLGRKSLMLFSTAFTSLSMATLAFYFYLDRIDHSSLPNIGWVPLMSLVLCFLSYDLGFGIIPGTLTGEMFRANVRSTGSSFTITVAWAVGFAISTAFGYMVPAVGADSTFLMYACFSACAFFVTIFFVPETKGKTLLEIEEMLSK